jgi:hypothetical protein
VKTEGKPAAPPQDEDDRPAPESIDLSDDRILELVRRARNGDEFSRLWAGTWEGSTYPSQSKADLALCNLLAFDALGRPEGCPQLGLPALGSFLWRHSSTSALLGPSRKGGEPVA